MMFAVEKMENLKNRNKLLIAGQLLLILWWILCAFLYTVDTIDNISTIEGLKYLIVFEIFYILYSIYVLKIGFLNVYSVFIMTVSLYNVSLIFISLFFNDNTILFVNNWGLIIKYDDSVVIEYLNIILIFYLFIHLSALCVFSKRYRLKCRFEWFYDRKMEYNGLVLFYLSLFPALVYYYNYFEQLFLVGGYLNKYEMGVSTSDMNIFVRISDDLMKLGFLLILASKGKVKRLIMPCSVYLIIHFLESVLSGSRVFFISQALFILVYFSMRVKINLLKILIVMLFFVVFTVFVGKLRSTTDYNYESTTTKMTKGSIVEEFVESFLINQGASMHIVGLTVYLQSKDVIEHSMRFLIFPLYNAGGYVKGRPADDYYFLADRLAAKLIPSDFAKGSGLGSSIIAEFYIYGSVLTVALFSMLYGAMICFLDLIKFQSNRFLLFFIILLPGLFYVGRADPLYPMLSTYKIFILYYILIELGIFNKLVRSVKRIFFYQM